MGAGGHEYVLGCLACPLFQSKLTEPYHLRRHHGSRQHLIHAASLFGIALGPSGTCLLGAPAVEEFLAVWKAGADNQKVAGTGCRKKIAQMHECILQAKLQIERQFMAQAETISLVRDESKGMLLIRALACTPRLDYRSLLLGLSQEPGSDAFDINRETRRIIQQFCGADNIALVERLCSRIEAICVDSASNETKSARLMRRLGPGDRTPLAPNLKAIIRDRAHASRRIISRPWKADPDLHDIAEKVVMSHSSIIQRIHHSTTFSKWYAGNLKAHCAGPFEGSTSLGAAKHRYETWSRPFGQAVMTIGALIRTAEQIIIERSGAEARDAQSFLVYLTEERFLQLGMLADASDEALVLTRIFDDETCDPAAQADDLSHFQARVGALFGQDHSMLPCCWLYIRGDFIPGGTDHCDARRWPDPWDSGGGGAGKLTQAAKHRCLQRMQSWLHLADISSRRSFQTFDLVHCFWIFQLANQQGKIASSDLMTPERLRAIRRLAQAFQISADALAAQWAFFMPLAQKHLQQTVCTNREAWQHAVCSRPRGQPADEITSVLLRYLGWAISTTGVEHTFAHVRRVLAHRGSCSPHSSYRMLKIIEPMPTNQKVLMAIVDVARDTWVAMHHGPSRQGKATLPCGRCQVHSHGLTFQQGRVDTSAPETGGRSGGRIALMA